MSKPTAKEILSEINEFFRHNNPVEPGALFDDSLTFKQAVQEYLEQQTKSLRYANLRGTPNQGCPW